MIQCPACGQEIADDSAHCGYCGEQIEAPAGKKTMIGMAAVTAEDIERIQAETEQAKQASAQAKEPTGLGDERSKPKPAGLSIPKPGVPSPSSTPSSPAKPPIPGSGKLSIPKPGQPSSPTDNSDAKTEVMNAVPSHPVDQTGPTDPFPSSPPQSPPAGAPNAAADFGAPANEPAAPPAATDDGFGTPPPDDGFGAPPADDGFGALPRDDGFGVPPEPAVGEETVKEMEPFDGSEPGVRVPTAQIGGEAGGMIVQEQTLPAKKNTKTMLIAIAAGGGLLTCCIFGTIFYYVIFPLL